MRMVYLMTFTISSHLETMTAHDRVHLHSKNYESASLVANIGCVDTTA